MPAIAAENNSKVFRVARKEPGVAGAVKALFRPHYTKKAAVDGASFTVEPGEMVGYIGVNGAGKSTTIKMLTGILAASAGSVRVLGRDPQRERVANARQIGVVFGQRTQLWWDLALIELLNMISKIYEVPLRRYKALLDEFTGSLELDELLNMPIRQMSLGQKMRAELAATLIHEPQVVYLDEPTIGLDLLVKERIRDFIRQQNEQKGITVILTTHDLGDIEELCERVIIIDDGKLIYDGPLGVIKERFGKFREIRFETISSLDGLTLPDGMDLPPGTELLQKELRSLVLRFDRSQTSASKVAAVVMSQVPTLNGWTLPELWLIYGLITLALSLNHTFANNLWTLGQDYVRPGNFDRLMVRPIDPLFHLLADRFNHDGIGYFLVGLALVVTSGVSLNIQWGTSDVLYMALAWASPAAALILFLLAYRVWQFGLRHYSSTGS